MACWRVLTIIICDDHRHNYVPTGIKYFKKQLSIFGNNNRGRSRSPDFGGTSSNSVPRREGVVRYGTVMITLHRRVTSSARAGYGFSASNRVVCDDGMPLMGMGAPVQQSDAAQVAVAHAAVEPLSSVHPAPQLEKAVDAPSVSSHVGFAVRRRYHCHADIVSEGGVWRAGGC